MTYEDFTNKFKKTNSFDKYWNYLISIAVIGVGLYFCICLISPNGMTIRK